MEALADRVRQGHRGPVALGYLDHDEPTIEASVGALAPSTTGVPQGVALLLSHGWHATQEVPGRLAVLGVDYAGSLRLGSAVLAAVAHSLAQIGVDPHNPNVAVVLAAAGSRRPGALLGLERLVQLAVSQGWPAISLAVASGPGPALAESLVRARAGKPERVVVVPLLLAPGVLDDRIRRDAAGAGAGITDVVGRAPQIVDAILATAAAGARVPLPLLPIG